MKRLWIFLIEEIKSLQYWSISPFTSRVSDEAGASALGILWLSQKVKINKFQKWWIQDLK